MSISDELIADILRYYHVEKWRVGTISTQLGLHHSTVKRVLSDTGIPRGKIFVQPSMIEPYLPFVLDTLQRYPSLTASRLYAMVRERGYPGGVDHFRHMISCYRPKPAAEAFLRLRTLPGEQAQVDWGHFGHMTIGKAKRPLMAFVMVLSYSRKIWLHFYLNQRMESFLSGHELAFQAFTGVPRAILYDNLKSAVLERMGDAIRFNPQLLAFAAHYRFEPRPVAVARGNEKGRVERVIRYIRDNFFAARTFADIDELNAQALAWCDGQAADRACPEDRSQSVRKVFEDEKTSLLSLPKNAYPVHESGPAVVGKTPYIRFDLNDYSVPHQYANRTLTVWANTDIVRILDGQNEVASHERCWDKGCQIEKSAHIAQLATSKRNAARNRGQHRLTYALTTAHDFLNTAAQQGRPLRALVLELNRLLDDYGAVLLDAAMTEALARGVPHPNAVRLSLQRLRDEQELPPPTRLDLSKNKRISELVVRPHSLSDYDTLRPSAGESHE